MIEIERGGVREDEHAARQRDHGWVVVKTTVLARAW